MREREELESCQCLVPETLEQEPLLTKMEKTAGYWLEWSSEIPF